MKTFLMLAGYDPECKQWVGLVMDRVSTQGIPHYDSQVVHIATGGTREDVLHECEAVIQGITAEDN